MKKNIITVLMVLTLFGLSASSCGGGGSTTKPEKAKEPPKMLKASAEMPPKWVVKTPSVKNYAYFVGTASAGNINDAKKASNGDAVRQLIEYIGFRATATIKTKTTSKDTDSVSSFQRDVEQKVSGTGSANVSVEVDDTYYEYYSDGSYTLYTLIKCPQSWIEKERDRLKKLVEQQRASAIAYSKQADTAVAEGNLAKAIDLEIQALAVSGKAEENSDVYGQFKDQLVLILSSLSFKMENTPQFAFEEGGSEPMNVAVYSSKVKNKVPGIMLDASEKDGKADLGGKNGTISDKEGMVYFTVLTNRKPDQLNVAISFSLKKFDAFKDDDDLYGKLQSMQKSQALEQILLVRSGAKIVQSCVVAFDVYEGKLKPMDKLRQALSVKMVDKKYSLVTVDVPTAILPSSGDEGLVQQKVISYIKDNYPDVKRIYFGFGIGNPSAKIEVGKILGVFNKTAGDILSGQSMQSVDLRFTLSIIDVNTMKVQAGQNIKTTSTGLNIDQALAGAEDDVLKKVELK
jgi:hypothetical protein